MNDADVKQLILNIINQAQEGKSIKFHYIESWQDYRYYRQVRRNTKILIQMLTPSARRLFKGYCKDVIAGISDVHKLLAYKRLCEVIAFYENDLEILKRMLYDYDEYLSQGNFWYSFLGGQRDTWNMH